MSKLLKWNGLEINPSKLNESTTIKLPAKKTIELSESAEQPSFVLPKIEAIHVGRTKNYVHYTADKLRGDASLKSGVYSWVDPYAKPVIYNHDLYTEATGRVLRAAYADYTQAGRPGIIVVPKITDAKAIKAIQDGRLLTVSVGAHTDAAICSICGTDIANEGFCGHMKGEEYDGQVAEWIAGNIWFDELSWVNLPADQDAMVVESESSMLVPTEKAEESVENVTVNEFYNIPRGVSVVEAVSSESNLPDKGGEEMSEEKKTVVTEEETEETVETEEAVEADETTEDEKPETEEVTEDADDKDADTETDEVTEDEADDAEVKDADQTEEAVVESDSASVETLEEMKQINIALDAQVKALSEELKTFYKQSILEKVDYDEETKTKFSERLDKRSLETLKETLEDVEAGFFVQTKKKEKRTPQKVTSPIQEAEEVKESDKQKVNAADIFVNLLRK